MLSFRQAFATRKYVCNPRRFVLWRRLDGAGPPARPEPGAPGLRLLRTGRRRRPEEEEQPEEGGREETCCHVDRESQTENFPPCYTAVQRWERERERERERVAHRRPKMPPLPKKAGFFLFHFWGASCSSSQSVAQSRFSGKGNFLQGGTRLSLLRRPNFKKGKARLRLNRVLIMLKRKGNTLYSKTANNTLLRTWDEKRTKKLEFHPSFSPMLLLTAKMEKKRKRKRVMLLPLNLTFSFQKIAQKYVAFLSIYSLAPFVYLS